MMECCNECQVDDELLEDVLFRVRELFIDSLLSFEELVLNSRQIEERYEQGVLEEGHSIVVRGSEQEAEVLPLVTLTENCADKFMDELSLILDLVIAGDTDY